MKRRVLLVRSLVAAMSAGVFTASGWLMGVRALTMGGDVCPGGYLCAAVPKKCVGANCPTSKGYCGYECDVYCCPDGSRVYVCNYSLCDCCISTNCPDTCP
jgi:hypothetical protein